MSRSRVRRLRTDAGRLMAHRAHIERLEPRMLLAGNTYLINFQSDEASIPTRYLRDVGETFGVRAGGPSYGWSTDQARERNVEPDQRLDTLVHIEAGAERRVFATASSSERTSRSDPDRSSIQSGTARSCFRFAVDPLLEISFVESLFFSFTILYRGS